MQRSGTAIQGLMSLPPKMADEFSVLEPQRAADWFVTADPPGTKLGSGGGTAHLLGETWRATGAGANFREWLRQSRKLMLHGGGESRRLPAYAAVGKPFIPVPVMRWSLGQRIDQTLLDLQAPVYRRLLAHASPQAVAMVTSGDVVVRYDGSLPAFPDVDVLALGVWVKPELAQHHGVFFCPRGKPETLAFFLQKPAPDKIRELSADYLFLVDTGIWLLSERAVLALMKKCGWDEGRQEFAAGAAQSYELYAELGLALGQAPVKADPDINELTSAVVALPQGAFYHFGASRVLIESVAALQNLVVDQTKLGFTAAKPHPDQYAQNSVFACKYGPTNHTLWIENSHIPATWQIASDHVLTGVPENQWNLKLEPGVCLDCVPVGEREVCVRFYGMDDPFRGPVGQPATLFLGQPAAEWLAAHAAAALDPQTDIFDTPLFPVLDLQEVDGSFVNWLVARQPIPSPAHSKTWQSVRRLSARQIAEEVNLARLSTQRAKHLAGNLPVMAANHRHSVFYKLDLEATAQLYARAGHELPAELPATADHEPMKRVQDQMFHAAVLRHRGQTGAEAHEAAAFALLRQLMIHEMELQPVTPTCRVLEDQIIWGRSPVRLDLAGGWTDTPPYCLQHGGRVVNVAVNLNGQPPIQVFARKTDQPELVVRSIDLGVEERVRTFEELSRYDQVGSGFTIAKAAFALAGFLPRFAPPGGPATLEEQLREFGGGIEVSLLCAVPKGSGLGTSSILAATLLGTVSDLCGLNWDQTDLFRRTLALEQMLTTGGGWQDQVGGLLRGLKFIETEPGLAQRPTVRWLPGQFFAAPHAGQTTLLYYTGITRVAKEILKEIVRGMFLNSQTHLAMLEDIGQNAVTIGDALQRNDWDGLCTSVARSWELNQRLDSGTNPPPVQAILDRVVDYLAGAKLLGAGGGGYLLMLAKDEPAGRRIRQVLTDNPPNAKARFVDLSLSETGFEVTRS